MKPHHLLVVLLVAVNALAAAALASLGELNGEQATWPEPLAAVIVGTALGQLTLAAAWLAWGRLLIAIRGAVLLIVLMGWLFPVAHCHVSTANSPLWGGILLLHALCVAAALGVVRILGANISLADAAPPAAPRIKPWQFTVGGVLTLTTLLAMLLGAGRHLDFPWGDSVRAVSFCVGTATAGAIATFASFRLKPLGLALAAPPLVGGIVGGLFWRFLRPDEAFIGMGILQGAVIALASGVLRVAGYAMATHPTVIPGNPQPNGPNP